MKKTLLTALFLCLALPTWSRWQDPRGVAVAERLMEAMGGREAFDAARMIQFDFTVERDGKTVASYQHWWDRHTGRYRLEGKTEDGKPYLVLFNVNTRRGRAWLDGKPLEGKEADRYVEKAYSRFINDTYWILMPWKWLDPGVSLHYQTEIELDGKVFDVVRLSFDPGVGLTSGDQYWGFVSKETGLMERWQYILQKDDGTEGDTIRVFTWDGWKDAGGGVLLSTRKTRLEEKPDLAIIFPVAKLSAEAPDAIFRPEPSSGGSVPGPGH